MKYSYEIVTFEKSENWIFIKHEDWDEPDGFINLLKRISCFYHGGIIEVGDVQYKVKNDKFNLTYQWDSCFGTVVIYNSASQKEDVIQFLEKIFKY